MTSASPVPGYPDRVPFALVECPNERIHVYRVSQIHRHLYGVLAVAVHVRIGAC